MSHHRWYNTFSFTYRGPNAPKHLYPNLPGLPKLPFFNFCDCITANEPGAPASYCN